MLLVFAGCGRRSGKMNIFVSLTDSNHSIIIAGFDRAIIADIGRDTAGGVWQSLLPVYKMPGDTDMKDYQNAQPGNYRLKDSVIIFTPDTPFKKDKVYFIRYYQHTEGANAWQYIRDKKRPGELQYIDLIFKY